MSELVDWLTKNKEIVALILSGAAFSISLLGYFQKSSEKRLGIRKQLTDSITKLLELNTELSKANDPKLKANYPANYGSLVADQRRLMVRQSKFLADKISKEVSPYEKMVIASGFDEIDDPIQAEDLFKQAMAETAGNFERVIVHRQYARFLFRQGREEDGRRQFEMAAGLLGSASDRHRIYNGDTYERWARAEKEMGDRTKFAELTKRATEQFSAMKQSTNKTRLLSRVLDLNAEFQREQTELMAGEASKPV